MIPAQVGARIYLKNLPAKFTPKLHQARLEPYTKCALDDKNFYNALPD